MIRLQNTRAIIEDFYKGKIGEIIFEEWGEDRNFVIIDKEKLATEIGRKICDSKDTITEEEIFNFTYEEFDILIGLINEEVMEYLYNNFEGKWNK